MKEQPSSQWTIECIYYTFPPNEMVNLAQGYTDHAAGVNNFTGARRTVLGNSDNKNFFQ